ncbi:MAG: sigma 54-interacting transcriptional regulator [Polyangiaceae bacterium]
MDSATVREPDGKAERHVPRLFLDGPKGPVELAVAPPAVVGSSKDAAIRVDAPTVSRVHAELTLRTDGLWVRDLGSRNGCFVQGVRVREARLDDGAVLRLGAATIRVRYAKPEADALWPDARFQGLVGANVAMRRLYQRLSLAAQSDATVLVHGETGTGKEVVARAIHDASPRRDGPFVTVDCGALAGALIESELFGHVRGAFTGALEARVGAIELAHGGTVFLDEIAELPLGLQPKLLRALESRTVRRVGASDHKAVDVRFVAATHRDIATMAAAGTFREDLYFRLAVLPVIVPSLRERLDDLPLLIQHFGADPTPDVVAEAERRPWPGNVRELRNFVDRVRALGAAAAIEDAAFVTPASAAAVAPRPGDVPLDVPFKELAKTMTDQLERAYLEGQLAKCEGNVSAVARAAGLDRSYVHRLLRKHGLVT